MSGRWGDVRPCVLMAGAALAAGCAAGGGDRASVLANGQQTLSAGLETTVTSVKLTPAGAAPLPGIQLASEFRHGFGKWDLGVRAWGLGVRGLFGAGTAVDGKLGLMRKVDRAQGWELSLRAGGGYHQINYFEYPLHTPFIDAALLAGYNLPGRHQMFFALRGQQMFVTGQDVHTVDLFFAGLSFGFAIRAGARWQLQPQVGIMYTPASFNGTLDDPGRRGLAVTHLGLGFVFDL